MNRKLRERESYKNLSQHAITCLYIASKYEEIDDNIPGALEFVQES
jgi:hypothetical protein